ncbi:MAG: hypothetical protein MZV64_60495 [Ignavibacteriales bacterium]|nr:hypothetical protein [Ignavibacteriales bacterium]
MMRLRACAEPHRFYHTTIYWHGPDAAQAATNADWKAATSPFWQRTGPGRCRSQTSRSRWQPHRGSTNRPRCCSPSHPWRTAGTRQRATCRSRCGRRWSP